MEPTGGFAKPGLRPVENVANGGKERLPVPRK